MNEKFQHTLSVIDFIKTEHNSIFVSLTGYDAVLRENFEGEVKFLGGMPFGDIIHQERTTLSPECREYIRELLLQKYNAGEFN